MEESWAAWCVDLEPGAVASGSQVAAMAFIVSAHFIVGCRGLSHAPPHPQPLCLTRGSGVKLRPQFAAFWTWDVSALRLGTRGVTPLQPHRR